MGTKKIFTKDKFAKAFAKATSVSDLIRKLGLSKKGSMSGGAYRTATLMASQYGFDLNAIKQRLGATLTDIIQKKPNKLPEAVQKCSSLTAVLKELGVSRSRGNYRRLREVIRRQGLIGARWSTNSGSGDTDIRMAPFSEVFTLNGRALTRRAFIERLIREGGRDYACENCDTGYMHNGEILRLQIHHKNSNAADNRIENLAILCPNCHTQTEFAILDGGIQELQHWVLQLLASRQSPVTANPQKETRERKTSKVSKKRKETSCQNCGQLFMGISSQKYCNPDCYHAATKGRPKRAGRKVKNRPSLEEIKNAVEETSWCAAAKRWNVSDNCLRKWVRLYGADPKSILNGSKFGPKPFKQSDLK